MTVLDSGRLRRVLVLLAFFNGWCGVVTGKNLRIKRRLEQSVSSAEVATNEEKPPRQFDHAYDAILSALPQGADPVDHYPYSMLRDYDEPLEESDNAFFWHIPKSAGSNLKHILGTCLNRSISSEYGPMLCKKQNELWQPTEPHQLAICANELGKFVNVDTSYGPGIGRAKLLGLVPSGLADVVVSIDFRAASTLFTPDHRGRAFVLLRHPVDRVVSTFYYLSKATWENHYNPDFANMSVEDYAKSNFCPRDWVTRSLLGLLEENYHRSLTTNDLNIAKEIVRRKLMVLLMDDFANGLQRLLSYFEWDDEKAYNDMHDCLKESAGNKENAVKHQEVEKGSEAWNIILDRNRYDMALYEYANEIYAEQGKTLFPDIS